MLGARHVSEHAPSVEQDGREPSVRRVLDEQSEQTRLGHGLVQGAFVALVEIEQR
jgi:hypothetical protein